MPSIGGWVEKLLNTLNQESDMTKMALLEDMSGTGMQHRLEGVGLEARTWMLFFPPKICNSR